MENPQSPAGKKKGIIKKLLIITLVIASLAVASGTFFYSQGYFDTTTNPLAQHICNTGGALKMFGVDWIGNDIVLECKCLGESEHKSKKGAFDADWVECKGEINYTCYKMNTTSDKVSIGPNENFMSYVVANSKEISCPPNRWMNSHCNNDSECDSLSCMEGLSPKCEELICACH